MCSRHRVRYLVGEGTVLLTYNKVSVDFNTARVFVLDIEGDGTPPRDGGGSSTERITAASRNTTEFSDAVSPRSPGGRNTVSARSSGPRKQILDSGLWRNTRDFGLSGSPGKQVPGRESCGD